MRLVLRDQEEKEKEKDNEVEEIDMTVHFKGDGRGEEEGGVRRKGARRGSKMRPLTQKVRRKCDPLGRNTAKGTSGGGGSKMRPLRQKVRQKCDPLSRNMAEIMSGREVKNATP